MKKLYYLILLFLMLSCKKYDYTWMTIGDSITANDGREFQEGADKGKTTIGYQTVFLNENKNIAIDLINKGYGGYSLAGHKKSIYQKVKDNNFKNVDLITIFVGTNDFKLNKPIISSDSLESFKYCYSSLVSKIQKQNKSAKIYLITPLRRNNDGYTSNSVNKAGLKLIDYVNATKEIGSEKGINVIDLYNESEINENNLYKYTVDGLHPNNEGYKIIGNELNKKIFLPENKKITYQ